MRKRKIKFRWRLEILGGGVATVTPPVSRPNTPDIPVPPPQPSQQNCLAQNKNDYNIPNINHGATQNISKNIANTPTNGLTQYSASANCENGNITIVGETSQISCNTDYGLNPANNQCEAVCDNPIYRDTNGVTIKARDCAVAGQEYDFEGEKYYVARDKNDIKQKIASGYRANRIVTSKITDLSKLFSEQTGNILVPPIITGFNDDIANWDTSNVTNMNYLFFFASEFNKDISNWNTSKVRTMTYMFGSTKKFNTSINNWDTSNVVIMNYMFAQAQEFNKPLDNWNTCNIKGGTDISSGMYQIFYGAKKFNQNISSWKVPNIKSMPFLFNESSHPDFKNNPSKQPRWGQPCNP